MAFSTNISDACPQFFQSINSLLPVSRYIDTALAEKGSHKKKTYNQNILTHIGSDY